MLGYCGVALCTRESYLMVSELTKQLQPLAEFADPSGDPAQPSVSDRCAQALPTSGFLGKSDNATKTQIWCTVATYVLLTTMSRCY